MVALSAGGDHTCALTDDERAFCWGRNSNGELGAGVGDPFSATPVAVAGSLEFANISAAWQHTCAVTVLGVAYCWGTDSLGQLGDGTLMGSATPVAVKSYVTLLTLAAGLNHTCAVSTFGALECWGNNGVGALGTGNFTPNSDVPVLVRSGRTFSMVTAGNNASCALTTAGVALCWGWNSQGQLGRGTMGLSSATPAPVTGGLTFAHIATTGDHSCALTRDGAAYCWGFGSNGALGNGDTTSSAVPVAVAGGLRFQSLSASYYSNCALTSEGAAYCWGLVGSLIPEPAAPGLRFNAVTLGFNHVCGLTSAGQVYCWGMNDAGQLGSGTAGPLSATPVLVRVPSPALSSAASVPATATVSIYPPFASPGGAAPARVLAVREASPCATIGQAPAGVLQGDRESNAPGGPFVVHAPGLPNVAASTGVAVSYPPELESRRVHGVVLVHFWINPAGCAEPESFKIVTARDSAMARAVRDALRRTVFVPATVTIPGSIVSTPGWQSVEEYFTFGFSFRVPR